MTEHETFPGKLYAVTCRTGCTLTDDNGMNETVEAGKQFRFMAQTPVVYTSEPASVTCGNFKLAPAELLGLLGGGVSTLPSGYLAAEFLESTGEQYMKMPLNLSAKDSVRIVQEHFCTSHGQFFEGQNTVGVDGCILRVGQYNTSYYLHRGNGFAAGEIVLNKWTLFDCYFYGTMARLTQRDGTVTEKDLGMSRPCSEYWLWRWNNSTSNKWNGKKRFFKVEVNGTLYCDMLPTINKNGVPCMFDKVSKQPFYNSGTGSFIVGMNMAQARKLGKLPAGGGTLTVSLPSNYLEDEGVVNALATAQERGWVITIQTYEAEAGAASTFALRRFWIRKTQDEGGSYVAYDGTRWRVEWCVDVWGADPQELGYEPFRSVEVATEYWNLQPWVDPEAEEILTNTEEV